MSSKIGFVGLGIMGRPMVKNLLKAGHSVTVYDIVPAGMDDVAAAGAQKGTSPKDVASKTDIIITMVPDTPHVEDALFSENGVAAGLSAGKIVVDMSSISPVATKGFAERIVKLGCEYLDAPVSGGEVGAKAGSLTIMVGGKQEAFDKVKPLFELMGKNITLVGGYGDGQITKVANQIIVALTIEAVGEALLLASKAGADAGKVREALMGGFAASRILEVHGERMITGNWKPGFKAKLFKKDLGIAMNTLAENGVPAVTSAVVAAFPDACDDYFTRARAYLLEREQEACSHSQMNDGPHHFSHSISVRRILHSSC